jgi:predicted Ser/Thr protein kinase
MAYSLFTLTTGPTRGETQKRPLHLIANRYEVLLRLGTGGFGNVYKAHDRLLERVVAVKTLHAGAAITPELRERFLREARATARLQHDNAVSLYDAGEDGDDLFLVLEYVEGRSLGQILASGPLETRAAVSIIADVARALDAAHRLGIVHRDVKPANILIRDDGRVKVADFGIARLIGESELTVEGVVVGTPRYMSPEQLEGRQVGPPSDIFSLGCVGREMVTDAADLGSIVIEMLQRDAEKRPSAADVVTRISGEPARSRKKLRRAARIAAAAIVAVLAVAGVVYFRLAPAKRTLTVKHAAVISEIAQRTGAIAPATQRMLKIGDIRFYRGRPSLILSTPREDIEVAGLSLSMRHVAGNQIELRAPRNQVDAAMQAVKLYDALYDYHFGQTQNLFAGVFSEQEVTVRLHAFRPDRAIELIASAAGWPAVVDPSAEDAVNRKLGGATPPDLEIRAPWDQIVGTLLRQYGLDAVRLEHTWLIVSEDRHREMQRRRSLQSASVSTPANLDDAARALSAASSDRGTVLINRRLHSLISVDYPEIFQRQKQILTQLDGIDHGPTKPITLETYTGELLEVHVHASDIHDFIGIISGMTGLNNVVDPAVRGRITMDVDKVPWDEAYAVALDVTRNTYIIEGNVMQIMPESARPPEPIAVETVKLRREDPEFFEAWKKSVGPRGSVIVDHNARLLVIRAPRSDAAAMRNVAETIDKMVSPETRIRIVNEILAHGLSAAIALQQRLKATNREFDFDDEDWIGAGYGLLAKGRNREAIELFKWLIKENPKSWNAYDSLGEAYLKSGMKQLAIENYQKSRVLNPSNGNAYKVLVSLGVRPRP